MDTAPHYPGYDVMREAGAWDDHTREIVEKRLAPEPTRFLSRDEAATLGALAAALLDDERAPLLKYVVSEIDGRLASGLGESQRKTGVPPQADLVRRGLQAIEATSSNERGRGFRHLTPAERQDLLSRVERGELPGTGSWQGLPQQDLFKKLLDLAVESYYSHPAVWSEIGHGGPAYPRGYVRAELDLTDPWEARREND
ncbi:MAG: gluconate 2-dehydrogenase subunit 3 family protein [Patescibacteria group bacterium]